MPKVLELFTATKEKSYVALLYIEGEEREALNIEGNSKATPQEFVELAAVTTAIECLNVSAGTGMSNLSGPIDGLEIFVESYQLYLLLTGRKEMDAGVSGPAVRMFDKYKSAIQGSEHRIHLRLMDQCGVCDCILHCAIENVYDRANRLDFEANMLNGVAPPGVILPKYAHQSAGPVPIHPEATATV